MAVVCALRVLLFFCDTNVCTTCINLAAGLQNEMYLLSCYFFFAADVVSLSMLLIPKDWRSPALFEGCSRPTEQPGRTKAASAPH